MDDEKIANLRATSEAIGGALGTLAGASLHVAFEILKVGVKVGLVLLAGFFLFALKLLAAVVLDVTRMRI